MKWLRSLNMPLDFNQDPFFVCKKHFAEGNMRRRKHGRVWLRADAVPYLGLPEPVNIVGPPNSQQNAKIVRNDSMAVSDCTCQGTDEAGPFYTHLVAGKDIESIRDTMAKRTGLPPTKINVLVATHHAKPYFTEYECVKASEVVERGTDEILLVVVKRRPGHSCDKSLTGLCFVWYDYVDPKTCEHWLKEAVDTTYYSAGKVRSVLTAEGKHCKCSYGGKSSTHGCTWLWRRRGHGGCKWFTGNAKKFQLLNFRRLKGEGGNLGRIVAEKRLEKFANSAADVAATVLSNCAPEAFANMGIKLPQARACRIGNISKAPFSSMTVVNDVSAHSHRDKNDLASGAAVILTIRPSTPAAQNQQFHVLPNYSLEQSHSTTGGLGILLPNGSAIIECAAAEWHSSTRVIAPNQFSPTRVGLVFTLHKYLHYANHGFECRDSDDSEDDDEEMEYANLDDKENEMLPAASMDLKVTTRTGRRVRPPLRYL